MLEKKEDAIMCHPVVIRNMWIRAIAQDVISDGNN
jgi:hypothetical protein